MQQQGYNDSAKPTALSLQGGTAVLVRTPKRAIVFVDGSNWYHKLRKLLNVNTAIGAAETKPPVDFNLRGFAQNLIEPNTLVDVRYYIGKIHRMRGDTKSEMMYANQQKLIGFLQKQHVHLGFGKLISYPDDSFHEKGVDILLAVQMIRCILEKKCAVAYLISSDTDLVPAVEECKRLDGEVVYVGSALHGQSFGLTKVCNRTILIQPKDVLPYMPPSKLFRSLE